MSKILMVVGNSGALTTSDAACKSLLEGMGHVVTPRSDEVGIGSADVTNFDAAVVLGASSSAFSTTNRDRAIPVLVSAWYLLDEMDMANTGTSQITGTVITTGGIAQTVYSAAGSIGFVYHNAATGSTKLPASATIRGYAAAAETDVCIYSIASGAAGWSGVAVPAKREAFLTRDSFHILTAAGQTLFSEALTRLLPATPTANAGPDQTVAAGASVTLDGSGSAPGTTGNAITYLWEQTGGTAVTLTGATTAAPTFTAPSPSTQISLTMRLTITETATGQAAQDTVAVTVQAVSSFTGPTLTAVTASPSTATTGQTVTLSRSYTAGDSTAVTTLWTPPSGVTLSSTTAASPTWDTTGDATGSYTFFVEITDGNGKKDVGQVTVTVVPAGDPVAPWIDGADGVYVELAALPAGTHDAYHELVIVAPPAGAVFYVDAASIANARTTKATAGGTRATAEAVVEVSHAARIVGGEVVEWSAPVIARGAGGLVPTDTGVAVAYDYECAPGRPVRRRAYTRAIIDGVSLQSPATEWQTITPADIAPYQWIKCPENPALNWKGRIRTWETRTTARAVDVVYVLGSPESVSVGGSWRFPDGALVAITDTYDEREALNAVWQAGYTLLIHKIPDPGWPGENVYVRPAESIAESLLEQIPLKYRDIAAGWRGASRP